MDREEWGPNEIPERIARCPDRHELDICPGWLVRQPTIAEGAQAYEASKSGELALFFPGNENTVLEAALTLKRAFNSFEAERLKRRKRGGDGSGDPFA